MFKSLRWSWFKRFFESTSIVFLGVIPPLLSVIIPLLWKHALVPFFSGVRPMSVVLADFLPPIPWFITGVIISILLIGMQIRVAWRKKTYDPTWVIKYNDSFWIESFQDARSKAATALSKHSDDFSRVDMVIGFFDDLGFYESGDQMSAEAIHQHFYYYLRGYYQAAIDRIKELRGKEPAVWEYVEEIFLKTSTIEAKKNRVHRESLFLSPEDLEQFLIEESGLRSSKDEQTKDKTGPTSPA